MLIMVELVLLMNSNLSSVNFDANVNSLLTLNVRHGKILMRQEMEVMIKDKYPLGQRTMI